MCDIEIAHSHSLRVSGYLKEANPKAGSRRRADRGGDADCVADQYPEAEVNFRDRPNLVFAVGERLGTGHTCHSFSKGISRPVPREKTASRWKFTDGTWGKTSGNAAKPAMREQDCEGTKAHERRRRKWLPAEPRKFATAGSGTSRNKIERRDA